MRVARPAGGQRLSQVVVVVATLMPVPLSAIVCVVERLTFSRVR